MTRNRAFSLAEVLVASAILALLGTVGVFLLQFGNRNAKSMERGAENHRQKSLAAARIRREMRGAQPFEPISGEQGQFVTYRYPRLVDGQLEVDANGNPVYEDEARIYQDEDTLKMEKPIGGPVQLLARLDGGTFSVEADDRFYRFEVVVGNDSEPRYRSTSKFRVARR